jgi:FkbM family methyltransferase
MLLRSYISELNNAKAISADAREFCKLIFWTALYHLGNKWSVFTSQALRQTVCQFNGHKMTVTFRQSTGDVFTLYEVIGREAYRLPMQIGEEVKIVVDLGANIGLTSLYYATLFPSAKVICVEPEPNNFDLLKTNCEQNGLHWTCLQQAIGGSSGKAMLSRHYYANQHSVLSGTTNDKDAIEVEMIKMDDLIREQKIDTIDLLKVDIEGAEYDLFAHCSAWILKVKLIIVEIHPTLVDYNGVIKSITKHGFHYVKASSLFQDSMDMFVRDDVADNWKIGTQTVQSSLSV